MLQHLSRGSVDREPVEREPFRPVQLRVRTAKHGSYPRDELSRRERLRHVVVRAELETDDAVSLLAPGRQHDHRQLRAVADPAAELETVHARQHQIEHDERGLILLDELAGAVSVGRLERAISLALEIAADDLTDDRFVVDDEDGRHVRSQPHECYGGLKSACVSPQAGRRTRPCSISTSPSRASAATASASRAAARCGPAETVRRARARR